MKIVGILGVVLFLFGGLVLIIGALICVNAWTSDYASLACKRAAEDAQKFEEAKSICGDTTSDCYKLQTIGLTTPEECEARTAYINKQMLMGAIPAVIGVLLGGVGLIMAVVGFVMARRRAKLKPA